MTTTIQITVAGALLAAWIWVLGRPIVSASSGPDGSDDGEGASPAPDRASPTVDRSASGLGPIILQLPTFVRNRNRVPVVRRRRQQVLATMFATFGAFFLAIAFHGTFVLLFGLMLVALAVHLVVASHVGARIVAEQRAAWVAQAKKRVRSDNLALRSPLIGAERVSDLISTGVSAAAIKVSMAADLVAHDLDHVETAPKATGGDGGSGVAVAGGSDDDGLDDDDDPFGLAADIAFELDSSGSRPGSAGPQEMVSDLIDKAWAQAPTDTPAEEPDQPAGEQRAPDERAKRAAGAETASTRQRPAADGRSGTGEPPGGGTAETSESTETEGTSEAIFTRPPNETKARSRRTKAKPIHIESELDDFPAAVNHR